MLCSRIAVVREIIGSAFILLVLYFGAFWGALPAQASALVRLATVTAVSLNPSVTSYGTVAPDPDHLVAVSLPRDVVVSSVSVRVGELVKPGNVIASVATAPAVISAFQQARNAVAFAEKDLVHTRYLFGLRLATNSQVAAAEKALADAE